MGRYLYKLYKLFPVNVWNLTFIAFLFIARKTFFNIQKSVEKGYENVADSSTSLAMVGIVLGILFLNSHFRGLKKVFNALWPILLYFLFAWVSFFWAEQEGAFTTISFKALENIVNILIVGLISLYVRDSKKMMLFFILFATASTSMELINVNVRFGLSFHHTNSYTFTAFIGMLLSFGCIRFGIFKLKELAVPIIICVYAWLTGTSTASYFAGLAGFLVLFSSRRKGVNIMAVFLVLLTSVIVWMLIGDYIYEFVAAGHSKGQMETGTGRDKLWIAAFKSWHESPWLGKGYILGETRLAGSVQHTAHNSFISVLVNTGIVGEALFVLCIVKWIYTSFVKSSINIYANIVFPVIVAIFVNLNACPVLGSHWSFVTDSVLMSISVTFLNFTEMECGDKRSLRWMLNNK